MINIAEKLKNVPVGTKLYSPLTGECELISISNANAPYSICLTSTGPAKKEILFDSFGRFYASESNGECLLWPSKENRDWENWQYCEFTEGETVLVRDWDRDPWKTGQFVKKDGSYFVVQHTISSFGYTQCIKFQDPYKL